MTIGATSFLKAPQNAFFHCYQNKRILRKKHVGWGKKKSTFKQLGDIRLPDIIERGGVNIYSGGNFK